MAKILILGGGFGGVRTALELNRKLKNSQEKFEIILIDQNSYHLFTPAIYEVASAFGIKKDPFAVQLKRTVCMPYADIFSGTKIGFIEAEILEINSAHQLVRISGDVVIEYDYLVVALGSETADYNIPGITEYTNQFRTLGDALFINQKLEELSKLSAEHDRPEPFSFLVCGGGFSGIELAAELGCYTKNIKEACNLQDRCSSITLFEAGQKILPFISGSERKYIKNRLTKLGIILMENSPIEEVGPDFVRLKNGQKVHGDIIIWTAGIQPNKVLRTAIGLPLSASGKITVENSLLAKGLNNVFAIGDNTDLIDPKTQKSVPGMAYVASDQGKIAATNIINLINKKSLVSYKPFYGIWIIPIGGKFALAHLWGGINIKGFAAWTVRMAVDIKYLLSIFSLNKAIEVFFNEITIFTKND